MFTQIFIIFILILINGLFAMTEIATVSSRRTKLEELVKKGHKNAKLVIQLSETPNKFLSTIQVGINLIAILLGVYSSAHFTDKLTETITGLGIPGLYSHDLALTIVVLVITFFTIVLGELLPKRIGLMNPEGIAMAMVRPMNLVSKIILPFVWLLSASTEFLVKLFNITRNSDLQVTEDEIKALLEEGTEEGSIQEIEQDIVERVFHLGDQRIGALMTNRNDIVWLNVHDSQEVNLAKISLDTHSIYPLCDHELDDLLGIVYSKDLLIAMLKDPDIDLAKHVKPANLLHSNIKAYQVLEKFKVTKVHIGFVVDEYGVIEGLVTINDILDGLVGDITDPDEPEIVERADGSWLIDGKMAFFEFIHEFEIDSYDFSRDQFHSLGGFAVHKLNEIPRTGDTFNWGGFHFEILDMDGNRVDKILLTRLQGDK
jgi:putative hemolysin